ncbi:MAG: M23 family metallopeptidase, partial [Flavobacteriales bacterium]|nr:M23 family metallopeptidase [Flavobacteriales bacterium]
NKAIQIRHGDYITVYQNITDVYVKKGDKVSTRQEIGKIFTNPTTGDTTLKFLIFQNTNKLNPEEWVYRM